jgi:acyl carrier protein phosphodiesterase
MEIQKGIILHRAIDTFTDAHPVFRTSTKKLHQRYHHYAGVIVDVFYDHFLSKNWANYSNENLDDYIQRFYRTLNDNREILTEKTIYLMPYMIKQNWLLSYQTVEGIDSILTQMDSRTKNQSKMRFASEELQESYLEFEQEFTVFFEDLRVHAREKLITL